MTRANDDADKEVDKTLVPNPGLPVAKSASEVQSLGERAEEDPVCKMKVLPSRAAAKLVWRGNTYYFCNPRCKEAFQANPQKYLALKQTEPIAKRGRANSAEPQSASAMNADTQSVSAFTAAITADSQSTLADIADSRSASADNASADNASDNNASDNAYDLKAFYLSETAFDFICPMDPEVRQKKPGSCPKCGMTLSASVDNNSSGQNQVSELSDLTYRLLVSGVLTIFLLGLSMPTMFAPQIIPLQFKQVAMEILPVLQLCLALPVVFWAGAPIFRKAIDSARDRQMNMFTLIAFGVSISFFVSLLNLVLPEPAGSMGKMLYFESAAGIVTLVLLGQVLELKARAASGQALESLFALAPSKARREVSGGISEEISVYEVGIGDRLTVLPGDKVPADGVVLGGRSSLDESLMSGNALPVAKSQGERVFAGTINMDGSLLIQAESLGRDTVFAQIIDLLANTQANRSPIQLLADRVSAIFIPSVLVIAVATFFLWITLAGRTAFPHAVQNMVAVLVIACPCALGLATPLAVSMAVARASKLGLMVKDARALELLAEADDILIDKTGTLTKGKFTIVSVARDSSLSEDEVLKWAASLEQGSKHPLAISICAAAKLRGINLLSPQEIHYSAGLGLSGTIAGHNVMVGSAKFMHANGLEPDLQTFNLEDPGAATHVYLSLDAAIKAVIVLADTLKEEAETFVIQIRELGLRPRILSGDGKTSVSAAAAMLKISQDDLYWDLLPQQKVERISELQAQGRIVAMLGDGVNDAAALAVADAGIAMATGADVAISSASISVMNSNLLSICRGIKLARLLKTRMQENLFLAFVYNILALFVATGILYPSTGIELNPAIAAGAMSLSSLTVIMNSLRLANAHL